MADLKSWQDKGKAVPNRQSIHVAPTGAKIQNWYDLGLEIDLASKTTLDAYQAIGLPEVWIYDNGQLTLHL